MNTLKKIGFIFLTFSVLLISCEEDPDPDKNFQQDFIGTWNAVETGGINGTQSYEVEITAGGSSEEILLNNLYNIQEANVEALLNGINFDIPNQTSKGFQFGGSGRANSDFDQITIDLTANDGTGSDEVDVVLTK